MNKRKAEFYEVLDSDKIRCKLCPHQCVIPPGEEGICWARFNQNGELYAVNYGNTTSIAVDPIEKKPLFHFKPGSRILSLAPNGCNMRCPYCQNYSISSKKTPTRHLEPEEVINLAKDNNTSSVAFTYSEPIIWFEFIKDVAKHADDENIDLVMVTNGLINDEPLNELLEVVDAMNIDLKSMDRDYYKKILKGDLDTTLNTIKKASRRIHVEVTNLLIPGDNEDDVEKIAEWLASLDKSIPLHISRYFPYQGYDRPPTPIDMLKKSYKIAQNYLYYVFIGNAPIEGAENTNCPDCSNLLIERTGYRINIVGIDGGQCSNCKREVDIVL